MYFVFTDLLRVMVHIPQGKVKYKCNYWSSHANQTLEINIGYNSDIG